uniref:immunoglobulin-like domain-containing protein n=1 Tax=Sphingobacterium athyrii TaxID=2152717 RepID=UPI0035E4034D
MHWHRPFFAISLTIRYINFISTCSELKAPEDILYGIEPKESQDFQIPISKLLKNKRLAPGIYRISKEVWFANQKKEPFHVVASFEIK